MNVVVVESPSKARTINKYLGDSYKVLASYGHVRDLVEKEGAVEPEAGFAMTYEIPGEKRRHVDSIVKALEDGDSLYLATDPDREGEAIAWHILEALKGRKSAPDVKVHRVAFHEVTAAAIREAFEHPREIDMALVEAQQARRALDYLVGYTLSPVLWRKLPGAKSAGRVQSVALRLICEREDEIEAFRSQEYWSVEAGFTRDGIPFSARLATLDGEKIGKLDIGDGTAAEAAAERIRKGEFTVAEVQKKQVRRHPAPPFTTSTLQQEASRKLGMSAAQTMRTAQKLYEGIELDGDTVGLITYMRTDAVVISKNALDATRDTVRRLHGDRYLPEKPNVYRSKAKNAQEAHEAIRPTDPARTPDVVRRRLSADDARLYELIWQRTLASQMTSAVFDQTTVTIAGADDGVGLRATGTVEVFDGFRKLYREGHDDPDPSVGAKEKADGDDEKKEEDEETSSRILPPLAEGDRLGAGAPKTRQHFTEPPPRYSEASLVRRLEELGVGRPSTYVSIISVLQNRNYVRLDRRRFVPEDRGRIVVAFLRNFFDRYVEYDFTADLEGRLDEVSRGELDWKDVLGDFWRDFKPTVDEVSGIRLREVLDRLDEAVGPHIFPPREDGTDPRACPRCKEGRLALKISRYGAFFGCSRYPECRHAQPYGANGKDGKPRMEPRELGTSPEGEPVSVRSGPYGPYAQLGATPEKTASKSKKKKEEEKKPKRVSIPPDVDPEEVTLDLALQLLALPRTIGKHPETGKSVSAGIGRYGPYVRHDGAYKSIPKGENVLDIGMNRAVDLLATASKRGGSARVIGKHPEDGKDITVRKGRFGPYVKHGTLNATIPDTMEPSEVTLEDAVRLLAERARRKAATGGKARRPASRKKKDS